MDKPNDHLGSPENNPRATSKHELDNDLPDYLVFLILGNIKVLRQVKPDHILVKAVEDALSKTTSDDPMQLELLSIPAFLRRQAD